MIKETAKAFGNKYEVGHSIRAIDRCPCCDKLLAFRWQLMGDSKVGYWLDYREVGEVDDITN